MLPVLTPTVISSRKDLPTPPPDRHARLESESQWLASHAVAPPRPAPLCPKCASPLPTTVTEALPVPIALVRTSEDTTPPYEIPSLMLATLSPV
eukprot:3934768-Rhodomonas_salina.1